MEPNADRLRALIDTRPNIDILAKRVLAQQLKDDPSQFSNIRERVHQHDLR